MAENQPNDCATAYGAVDNDGGTMTTRLYRTGKNTLTWTRRIGDAPDDSRTQAFAAEVLAEVGFAPVSWSKDRDPADNTWVWRSDITPR